jgi:protein MYSM1
MEALAIIDIHAHCVKTEVIGLLGGVYCEQTQQLFILTAEPCASLEDHDLQCDMDPVSQAEAKESLESKNSKVVGWYHSHPTFVPNPSLRDLETQSNFQQMFSKESGQPFIALILSPYSTVTEPSAKNTLVSKFKCLWVSDQTNIQVFICKLLLNYTFIYN